MEDATTIYTPKKNIAHTHSLIYNRELTITLVYKYKIYNIILTVNDKNKRQLYKIF